MENDRGFKDIWHKVRFCWGEWEYEECELTKDLLRVKEKPWGHYLVVNGKEACWLGGEDMGLIKQFSNEREIPYLVHFTQVENLPSIMKNGLLSRTVLEQRGMAAALNDSIRYDRKPDGISLSIAFPNEKLFYVSRRRKPDARWCVLVLDDTILWKKPCAFYRHNATSSRYREEPIKNYMTVKAFKNMYNPPPELDSTETKPRLNIWHPADVQGEVMVFDGIENELIWSVIFDDRQLFLDNIEIAKNSNTYKSPTLGFFNSGTGFFGERKIECRKYNDFELAGLD